jgi:ribosomal 50S subunit-recycling heat shock protein
MRLDLFLKSSRLVPRRTIAQEMCDAGLISVNGATAKSSREVKPEDEIEIKRRSRVTRVIVRQVPTTKQVSKQVAGGLYQVLEETAIDDDTIS